VELPRAWAYLDGSAPPDPGMWSTSSHLSGNPTKLAKTQKEAELQHASIDVLISYALEKHLKDLKVARQNKEAEMREYARLALRAHFVENHNECLTENTIRLVGKKSLGLN
jgi:hypothetical protein